jgi:hypothetical protein
MAGLSTSFQQVFSEKSIYRFVCSFEPTLYLFCYNLMFPSLSYSLLSFTHIFRCLLSILQTSQTISFLVCRNNRLASSLLSAGQVSRYRKVFTVSGLFRGHLTLLYSLTDASRRPTFNSAVCIKLFLLHYTYSHLTLQILTLA